MIAGRAIVLVAEYALKPEVRAEIENVGALVIDVGQCEPSVVVRHVRHAMVPASAPSTRALLASAPKPPSAPRQLGVRRIACRVCGAPVALTSGRGPHAARAKCGCGAWRWVAKAEPQRAGIDAEGLPAAAAAGRGGGGTP